MASVAHAEVNIGDSVVMMGSPSPSQRLMPGMIYLYVEDTDATYKKAIAAGGKSLEEPNDAFYGDRRAAVEDSTGQPVVHRHPPGRPNAGGDEASHGGDADAGELAARLTARASSPYPESAVRGVAQLG